MNFAQLFLRAALLAACAAAAEAATPGTAPAAPKPADAAQPVPPTRYQGALSYRPAAPQIAPADQHWKAANRTVGSYSSMSLTMRGMADSAPAADAQVGHTGHGASAASPDQHQHQHHEGGR